MDASRSSKDANVARIQNIHSTHSSEYLSLKKLGQLVLIFAGLGPILAMVISTLVLIQLSHKQIQLLENRMVGFEENLKQMNLMPWETWHGIHDRLNTRIERIEDKIWPSKINE